MFLQRLLSRVTFSCVSCGELRVSARRRCADQAHRRAPVPLIPEAPAPSKSPICPALWQWAHSLVKMAQISVHSLWHYIWEIKTGGQILWSRRNSPATDEMNIINKLYAGKEEGGKKKSNLAYCIRRATNVMVGIVVRGSVCHKEPCKARMSGR